MFNLKLKTIEFMFKNIIFTSKQNKTNKRC